MDQHNSYNYEVPSMPDPTFNTIDTVDSTLEKFFSRPIRIQTLTWNVGSTIFLRFDPWTLFWTNPRNINRITNYKLLRCKLHVSFKLNGNAFHYGRAIASYIPLQGTRPFDDMTVDRAFFIQDVIAASQRPHIYLDPTTNSGGELTLPFFFIKNYLSVPDGDWQEMGDIIIHTMQELQHANGATDAVTVQVFAWASDVEFGVPTASDALGLVAQAEVEEEDVEFDFYELQSGKGKGKPKNNNNGNNKKKGSQKSLGDTQDEYTSDGIISKPAAMIAKVAGMLETAPFIGPYAKATQLAASGVAGIARIFGYSRPAILEPTSFNKFVPTGNMANVNMPDNCHKLSLDAKQELTIDTRTVGLDGSDELDIKSLCMRESYITQFPWQQAAIVNDVLFRMNMTPEMYDTLVATNVEFHMTPACWISQLFEYWHGAMEVRLQFVCSAYHKGRVKVTYDPEDIGTSAVAEDNITFQQIIDLAETRDVTIKIPWGREFHWLSVAGITASAKNFVNPGGVLNTLLNQANGVLKVSVLNELTTPNSTLPRDIAVNVFVKMCDDVEFANPTSEHLFNFTYFPQADPELEDMDDFDAEYTDECAGAEPVSSDSLTIMPDPMTAPSFLDIYPGEVVTSLRTMLKRYNYHAAYGPTTTGSGYLNVRYSTFPYYRGDPTGAIHATTTPVGTWNFCQMTYINYLVPAFAGWKGSLRWKWTKDSNSVNDGFGYLQLSRMAVPIVPYNLVYNTTGQGALTSVDRARNTPALYFFNSGANQFPTFMDGGTLGQTQMGAVEAEFPFYSEYRFFPAKMQNKTTDANFNMAANFNCLCTVFASTYCNINSYCSVGEDFNMFFFTGAPVIFQVGNPGII